jgi:hypothetical protein
LPAAHSTRSIQNSAVGTAKKPAAQQRVQLKNSGGDGGARRAISLGQSVQRQQNQRQATVQSKRVIAAGGGGGGGGGAPKTLTLSERSSAKKPAAKSNGGGTGRKVHQVAFRVNM